MSKMITEEQMFELYGETKVKFHRYQSGLFEFHSGKDTLAAVVDIREEIPVHWGFAPNEYITIRQLAPDELYLNGKCIYKCSEASNA